MEDDADRDADDRTEREADGGFLGRESRLLDENPDEDRLPGGGGLPEATDDVLERRHRVLVDLERPRPPGREVELAVADVERAETGQHRDPDPDPLENAHRHAYSVPQPREACCRVDAPSRLVPQRESSSLAAMSLDPARVVSQLRELRELTGDAGGAQRVAWTDTWNTARAWLDGLLDGLPLERHRDAAGTTGGRSGAIEPEPC